MRTRQAAERSANRPSNAGEVLVTSLNHVVSSKVFVAGVKLELRFEFPPPRADHLQLSTDGLVGRHYVVGQQAQLGLRTHHIE